MKEVAPGARLVKIVGRTMGFIECCNKCPFKKTCCISRLNCIINKNSQKYDEQEAYRITTAFQGM